MITRKIKYIAVFLTLIPAMLYGQGEGNAIRREVTLYNPFKPTLNKENKVSFLPDMRDTTAINPLFSYRIAPNVFIPQYELKTIGAARLEPDPLPKLYKSYLKVGFGNYFSPIAELSISSERSRNRILGFYADHNSSFGKIRLANEEDVFAGYMDNTAKMYGTKFFKRSALTGNIDFNHMRRFAYGYDAGAGVLPEPSHDSLRIDYINPGATMSFYSTRLDSAFLDYDVKLFYDLLYQNDQAYQHHAGTSINAGYDLKVLYARARVSYEYFKFSQFIDFRPRHVVSFDPSISRSAQEWSFKVGLKLVTDSRNQFDPEDILPAEYKTKMYLHPDVRFQFAVIPSFVNIYVALDGEYENNQALDIIGYNPFIVAEDPSGKILASKELFMIKPTDHKLRVGGGILGSASEFTTYKITAAYSLFEDMSFFVNDTITGRTFIPVYDNGELLSLRAELNARINEQMSFSAAAGYYGYTLESELHPWNKPSWDGNIKFNYNLRNKILASAELNGLSRRYAKYGPMGYSGLTDATVTELPVHFSLNLGIEYRYTKILSFWTRLNNLSTNRYSEWNLYPSQRFLFMAGFSYSL